MTRDLLTGLLAEKAMGWRIAPDRFLLGERKWKPRHYFQPTKRPADALRLLKIATVESYTVERNRRGNYTVSVRIAGRHGEATERSGALAISLAVARALQIDIDEKGLQWKR